MVGSVCGGKGSVGCEVENCRVEVEGAETVKGKGREEGCPGINLPLGPRINLGGTFVGKVTGASGTTCMGTPVLSCIPRRVVLEL